MDVLNFQVFICLCKVCVMRSLKKELGLYSLGDGSIIVYFIMYLSEIYQIPIIYLSVPLILGHM